MQVPARQTADFFWHGSMKHCAFTGGVHVGVFAEALCALHVHGSSPHQL